MQIILEISGQVNYKGTQMGKKKPCVLISAFAYIVPLAWNVFCIFMLSFLRMTCPPLPTKNIYICGLKLCQYISPRKLLIAPTKNHSVCPTLCITPILQVSPCEKPLLTWWLPFWALQGWSMPSYHWHISLTLFFVHSKILNLCWIEMGKKISNYVSSVSYFHEVSE